MRKIHHCIDFTSPCCAFIFVVSFCLLGVIVMDVIGFLMIRRITNIDI